ncbi:MAG: hypothetical protein KC621_14215 [Myxococcales bacterium]|nr:hypothetical protein [Myxococcales bacterium]
MAEEQTAEQRAWAAVLCGKPGRARRLLREMPEAVAPRWRRLLSGRADPSPDCGCAQHVGTEPPGSVWLKLWWHGDDDLYDEERTMCLLCHQGWSVSTTTFEAGPKAVRHDPLGDRGSSDFEGFFAWGRPPDEAFADLESFAKWVLRLDQPTYNHFGP